MEITFNPLTADKVNSEWAEAWPSTLYLQHTHILIERRRRGKNTAESGFDPMTSLGST